MKSFVQIKCSPKWSRKTPPITLGKATPFGKIIIRFGLKWKYIEEAGAVTGRGEALDSDDLVRPGHVGRSVMLVILVQLLSWNPNVMAALSTELTTCISQTHPLQAENQKGCSLWIQAKLSEQKSEEGRNLICFYWWPTAKFVQMDTDSVKTTNWTVCGAGLSSFILWFFLRMNSAFWQHNTRQEHKSAKTRWKGTASFHQGCQTWKSITKPSYQTEDIKSWGPQHRESGVQTWCWLATSSRLPQAASSKWQGDSLGSTAGQRLRSTELDRAGCLAEIFRKLWW